MHTLRGWGTELAEHVLKQPQASLAQAAARTLDAVVHAIGQLLGAYTAPECANDFANTGLWASALG
jgi:hypothetical protein